MKPLNIVIVAPNLDPRINVSGISSVTQFIIESNRNGRYIHFELGRKDGEKRNLAWIYNYFKTCFSWFKLIRDKKIDLVHFNLALSKHSVFRDVPLIFTAKLLGKPLIIHLHGGELLSFKQPSKFISLLIKKVIRKATEVICLSEQEKELIVDKYHPYSIHVLPNAVDTTLAGMHRAKYVNGPMKILFLGRISAEKGLPSILLALEKLKADAIPFQFTIAGKGPEQEYFIRMFKEKLGEMFTYKGVVSGNEKKDLISNHHIFLLPSRYEGLPMSLLETMAQGVVPLVTSVGAISTVVNSGQNGIILTEPLTLSIVEHIKKLQENAAFLSYLSTNALISIESKFNPVFYVSKLNHIYQRTLENVSKAKYENFNHA